MDIINAERQESDSIIVLPKYEELRQRLLSVDSEYYTEEHLFSLILKHAGRKYYLRDIVVLLVLAIEECTMGMSQSVRTLMQVSIPSYLSALILNEDALAQAIAAYSANY